MVADPLSSKEPWLEAAIDWDATLAYRRHLWSWGFGVAEAMDTAQRGMGLDWSNSLELIRRSIDGRADQRRMLVAAAPAPTTLRREHEISMTDIIAAYEEQCAAIEKLGGRIILMASRALAACAKSPDDYAKVYDRILSQVKQPVIIHWLGEMFDPALEGYWGQQDHYAAMDVCLGVIAEHASRWTASRSRCSTRTRKSSCAASCRKGVRMYTGDDFNFAELIEGDCAGLLAMRCSASSIRLRPPPLKPCPTCVAMRTREYHEVLAPTVPLVAPHLQGADALL